jgi:hypothetical protein
MDIPEDISSVAIALRNALGETVKLRYVDTPSEILGQLRWIDGVTWDRPASADVVTV